MTDTPQSELDLARRELRAQRAENASLARTVDELEHRLLEAQRQNERYAGQLIALRRTLPWRVAAPVRILKRSIIARVRNAAH